jgi:hypothetical protein
MPLYEIVLEQLYAGQQIINRWNYISSDIPEGESGALLALVGMGFMGYDTIDPFWEDSIAYLLRNEQSGGVEFVQAIAKNLYSVTDFYTYAFPPDTNGLATGSSGLSPATAVGFATDRTRADIRRGQKRFVGVTEASVIQGGLLDPTSEAAWQAVGNAMADLNIVPVDATTVTFTPYVFGRESYTTSSGRTAYKYYETAAEQLEHTAKINQWNVKPQTRTQVSRQYGRGS